VPILVGLDGVESAVKAGFPYASSPPSYNIIYYTMLLMLFSGVNGISCIIDAVERGGRREIYTKVLGAHVSNYYILLCFIYHGLDSSIYYRD